MADNIAEDVFSFKYKSVEDCDEEDELVVADDTSFRNRSSGGVDIRETFFSSPVLSPSESSTIPATSRSFSLLPPSANSFCWVTKSITESSSSEFKLGSEGDSSCSLGSSPATKESGGELELELESEFSLDLELTLGSELSLESELSLDSELESESSFAISSTSKSRDENKSRDGVDAKAKREGEVIARLLVCHSERAALCEAYAAALIKALPALQRLRGAWDLKASSNGVGILELLAEPVVRAARYADAIKHVTSVGDLNERKLTAAQTTVSRGCMGMARTVHAAYRMPAVV